MMNKIIINPFQVRPGDQTIVHVGIGECRATNIPHIILKTILGSCVGAVAFGKTSAGYNAIGLAHIQMDYKNEHSNLDVTNKPAAFADTAIPLLIKNMLYLNCNKYMLKFALFGGGNVLHYKNQHIGEKNLIATIAVLKRYYYEPSRVISGGDTGMIVAIDVGKAVATYNFIHTNRPIFLFDSRLDIE
ncbi:MAG: hypothetical protein ABIH39_04850 [Candidatus Margulisiibacteriota bacterium]